MRKEEGATVAATPTFPHSAGSLAVRLSGRTGSVSTETTLQEAPIKYHKCPTFDAKRKTPAIFRHLIDSPKQMTNTCKEAVVKAEAKTVAY